MIRVHRACGVDKVKGALDDDWSEWFDGLTIRHDAAGDTLLGGAVRDQTALYGLIAKAREMTVNCGRRPATVEEARDLLGVPQRVAA